MLPCTATRINLYRRLVTALSLHRNIYTLVQIVPAVATGNTKRRPGPVLAVNFDSIARTGPGLRVLDNANQTLGEPQ
jgi:hypothetical protein